MNRAAWTWTGFTVIGLVAALLSSFVVATLPGRYGWDPSLRLDLAAWLILFGVLGAGGTLLAARLAFGGWPHVDAADGALAAAGIGIATAEELLLHEWAEGSLGYYDWDFIGPTAGLSFAVTLLAIAVFGMRVAPAGASAPPRLAVVVAGVGVVGIVLSNLPDLLDGIGRGGAVAVAIGLAGLYAVGMGALALMTRR